jgi:hypothetical protein
MTKKLRVTVFALVAVLALSSGSAIAATATGSFGYYGPQAGWSYKNQNTIHSYPTSVYAVTAAYTNPGGNAPAGYIGV